MTKAQELKLGDKVRIKKPTLSKHHGISAEALNELRELGVATVTYVSGRDSYELDCSTLRRHFVLISNLRLRFLRNMLVKVKAKVK